MLHAHSLTGIITENFSLSHHHPLSYSYLFFRLKHNYKKHNNDTTQNVEWKQSNKKKAQERSQ